MSVRSSGCVVGPCLLWCLGTVCSGRVRDYVPMRRGCKFAMTETIGNQLVSAASI